MKATTQMSGPAPEIPNPVLHPTSQFTIIGASEEGHTYVKFIRIYEKYIELGTLDDLQEGKCCIASYHEMADSGIDPERSNRSWYFTEVSPLQGLILDFTRMLVVPQWHTELKAHPEPGAGIRLIQSPSCIRRILAENTNPLFKQWDHIQAFPSMDEYEGSLVYDTFTSVDLSRPLRSDCVDVMISLFGSHYNPQMDHKDRQKIARCFAEMAEMLMEGYCLPLIVERHGVDLRVVLR